MNALSSLGLVLRRQRHLDEDVKLTLLLRDHGKIIAVSKGGLRLGSKLKALHEPFTEADFQIYLPSQGVNGRVTGGKLVDSFHGLRADLGAFQFAAASSETVEALLPFRAPATDVFDILRDTFRGLQSNPIPELEWVFFVVRLLKCLGHGDLSARVKETLSAGAAGGAEAEPAVSSVKRCRRLVDDELGLILPWRLRSMTEAF